MTLFAIGRRRQLQQKKGMKEKWLQQMNREQIEKMLHNFIYGNSQLILR